MLPLREKVDLRAIAMKGLRIPQSPSPIGTSPSDYLVSYRGHSLDGGGLTLLQRSSWCILEPQTIRLIFYPILAVNKPVIEHLLCFRVLIADKCLARRHEDNAHVSLKTVTCHQRQYNMRKVLLNVCLSKCALLISNLGLLQMRLVKASSNIFFIEVMSTYTLGKHALLLTRLTNVCKSDLSDEIKREFFKAVGVSVLLYGLHHFDSNETPREKGT